MTPEIDSVTTAMLVLIILFFVIAFLIVIVSKFKAFTRDLDYINREIARTEGREQQYWKKEKRRLWLSLLPFYRR